MPEALGTIPESQYVVAKRQGQAKSGKNGGKGNIERGETACGQGNLPGSILATSTKLGIERPPRGAVFLWLPVLDSRTAYRQERTIALPLQSRHPRAHPRWIAMRYEIT
jgi:hypothetical protein